MPSREMLRLRWAVPHHDVGGDGTGRQAGAASRQLLAQEAARGMTAMEQKAIEMAFALIRAGLMSKGCQRPERRINLRGHAPRKETNP